MKLTVLKHGNLLGTPDVKKLLQRCEQAGEDTDPMWDEVARIKLALGYDGTCTTVLLEHPDRSDLFPALVDPSFLTVHQAQASSSTQLGLRALSELGLPPEQIRSVLVTHAHPDHLDPAFLRLLPRATVFAHALSGVPGCEPFPEAAFAGTVIALDTPGHGCPHSSYVLELAELELAICLAGDLIMSHEHYLTLDHPLSFADHEAGRRSVQAVLSALRQLGRRHTMVLPGHGRAFFV